MSLILRGWCGSQGLLWLYTEQVLWLAQKVGRAYICSPTCGKEVDRTGLKPCQDLSGWALQRLCDHHLSSQISDFRQR